tara:strand:+ start:519 stop:1280 length:762 start_codon:yes stop_codon:yes gene_type:complete
MTEWMEELRKLDQLRKDSLISDIEYDKQKALIIPSGHTPSFSAQRKYILGGLGKGISILAVIFSFFSLFRVIAFANRANLINDFKDGYRPSFSAVESADDMVLAAVSTTILVNIALLICMIIWAWRATTNLDSLGISHRWGRGWAIGSWFTPIMLCFVPYQIISDAWKKAPNQNISSSTSNFQSVDKRNNFWLIGFILWWVQIALTRLGANQADGNIDEVITADVLGAVGSGVGIIAGILIAMAFRQMSERHS